jgi:cell division septum initiation protein DivIVA
MAQSQGGQAVSIIDQIADDRDKAQQENKQLKDRIKHLEAALRRIANQDYRGNRSTESQIAAEALKP